MFWNQCSTARRYVSRQDRGRWQNRKPIGDDGSRLERVVKGGGLTQHEGGVLAAGTEAHGLLHVDGEVGPLSLGPGTISADPLG